MGNVTFVSAMRDGLEALFVIAVGGMMWSVLVRLRRGDIEVVRCAHCGRPTSNAYPACKQCGQPSRPAD